MEKYYADYDENIGMYGVFDNTTGKCYYTASDEQDCKDWIYNKVY